MWFTAHFSVPKLGTKSNDFLIVNTSVAKKQQHKMSFKSIKCGKSNDCSKKSGGFIHCCVINQFQQEGVGFKREL